MRTWLIGIVAAAGLCPALLRADTAKKTLSRVEDPVVLTGPGLAPLAGAPLSELNLYACRAAGCKPIPFQVDKKDAEGHYVFTDDSLRPPGRDGHLLDANDELVFMAADAGDRVAATQLPAGKRAAEIKLTDPANQGAGWIYAVEAPGQTRSPDDYIQFSRQGNALAIKTPLYERTLEIGKPGSSARGSLRLRRPDGSWGQDVLDGFIAGMYVQFLKSAAVPLAYPEYLVRERVIGVIDGPVRLVIGNIRIIYVGPISFQFGTEVVSFNYRNQGTAVVAVGLPFSPKTLAKSAYAYWGIDLTPAALGSQYFDPVQSGPLTIDGRAETVDLATDRDWWALSGPEGAIMDAIILDERLGQTIVRGGHYEEKPEKQTEKEEHPFSPRIGFGLLYFEKLDKGAYHWTTYHLFPSPWSRAKADEFMAMIKRPLEVTVTGL